MVMSVTEVAGIQICVVHSMDIVALIPYTVTTTMLEFLLLTIILLFPVTILIIVDTVVSVTEFVKIVTCVVRLTDGVVRILRGATTIPIHLLLRRLCLLIRQHQFLLHPRIQIMSTAETVMLVTEFARIRTYVVPPLGGVVLIQYTARVMITTTTMPLLLQQ